MLGGYMLHPNNTRALIRASFVGRLFPCALICGLALQILSDSEVAQRRPITPYEKLPIRVRQPLFVRGRSGFVQTQRHHN